MVCSMHREMAARDRSSGANAGIFRSIDARLQGHFTDGNKMFERSALLAIVAGLAMAAPLAVSAQGVPPHAPPPIWGGAVFHGYGGAWIGWPCGGYGCGLAPDYRTQLRRELRFQELRTRGSAAEPSVYPMLPRDLPPPTPASDIQPAYRDASQIRPEFLREGNAQER